MRIIVISDTHGNYRALSSVFTRNGDADWFIHLGDGEKDLDHFILDHPELASKMLHASGNCDIGSLSPGYVVLPLPFGHLETTSFHASNNMSKPFWYVYLPTTKACLYSQDVISLQSMVIGFDITIVFSVFSHCLASSFVSTMNLFNFLILDSSCFIQINEIH